jgi:hypothetical protein
MSKSIPKPHNSGYVLALAFCDCLKDKTGTPKAIMASQQVMASHGISYVYLHSVKKTLFRDDQMLFCEFGVTVDGVEAGVFSIAQVCEALCSWQKSGFSLLELHIHHLLYVSLEKVSELLKVTGKTPVRAFLHDYYLCCTSYNLQNRSGFCTITISPSSWTNSTSTSRFLRTREPATAFGSKYLETTSLREALRTEPRYQISQ